MKTQLLFLICFAAVLVSCKKKKDIVNDPVNAINPTCSATKVSAENISVFPADNALNQDISSAAIDPYSTQIISGFAANSIKADFGSGLWDNAPIGIPYVVVCGNQQKTNVVFTDYGDESDAGPYPIPLNAPIEGNGVGDAHAIAVDVENKKLYELFNPM